MDRTTLLSRRAKTLAVQHEGETYHVRKLSQAAAETLGQKYAKPETGATGIAYVIQQTLAQDEQGERVFSDSAEDLRAVQTLDFDLNKALAEAAMTFSGLAVPKADSADSAEGPGSPKARA